ncbi:hypothetical protein [Francisella adeliensis]|uniref:Lipoprotein n=1 Tax=Francisella adeliensis TaxID=2007306 RepID=A0A2Z4XYG9_9GAMM|nr:hypothetical protein [Francisella adeliensis]AXA33947.1 hypothetical protein CDH04_05735 [Francisella adeliensis]MBK2085856.1 hypothetical protein [Francisella adeliensis]MBK2097734.1 hypothetical protein [Francisella adeliensis]QIW12183.1 hypothetical protein FZC43_05740 [Francisella adeliensis]QIW14059.1 hypothetical protein FZC44_05740 [Francisella adeliensis]
MKKIMSILACILLLSACSDLNSNEKNKQEIACSNSYSECVSACSATITHAQGTCKCVDWPNDPGVLYGECRQGAYCVHQKGPDGPYTQNAMFIPGPSTMTQDSECLQKCTQSLHQCNPK